MKLLLTTFLWCTMSLSSVLVKYASVISGTSRHLQNTKLHQHTCISRLGQVLAATEHSKIPLQISAFHPVISNLSRSEGDYVAFENHDYISVSFDKPMVAIGAEHEAATEPLKLSSLKWPHDATGKVHAAGPFLISSNAETNNPFGKGRWIDSFTYRFDPVEDLPYGLRLYVALQPALCSYSHDACLHEPHSVFKIAGSDVHFPVILQTPDVSLTAISVISKIAAEITNGRWASTLVGDYPISEINEAEAAESSHSTGDTVSHAISPHTSSSDLSNAAIDLRHCHEILKDGIVKVSLNQGMANDTISTNQFPLRLLENLTENDVPLQTVQTVSCSDSDPPAPGAQVSPDTLYDFESADGNQKEDSDTICFKVEQGLKSNVKYQLRFREGSRISPLTGPIPERNSKLPLACLTGARPFQILPSYGTVEAEHYRVGFFLPHGLRSSPQDLLRQVSVRNNISNEVLELADAHYNESTAIFSFTSSAFHFSQAYNFEVFQNEKILDGLGLPLKYSRIQNITMRQPRAYTAALFPGMLSHSFRTGIVRFMNSERQYRDKMRTEAVEGDGVSLNGSSYPMLIRPVYFDEPLFNLSAAVMPVCQTFDDACHEKWLRIDEALAVVFNPYRTIGDAVPAFPANVISSLFDGQVTQPPIPLAAALSGGNDTIDVSEIQLPMNKSSLNVVDIIQQFKMQHWSSSTGVSQLLHRKANIGLTHFVATKSSGRHVEVHTFLACLDPQFCAHKLENARVRLFQIDRSTVVARPYAKATMNVSRDGGTQLDFVKVMEENDALLLSGETPASEIAVLMRRLQANAENAAIGPNNYFGHKMVNDLKTLPEAVRTNADGVARFQIDLEELLRTEVKRLWHLASKNRGKELHKILMPSSKQPLNSFESESVEEQLANFLRRYLLSPQWVAIVELPHIFGTDRLVIGDLFDAPYNVEDLVRTFLEKEVTGYSSITTNPIDSQKEQCYSQICRKNLHLQYTFDRAVIKPNTTLAVIGSATILTESANQTKPFVLESPFAASKESANGVVLLRFYFSPSAPYTIPFWDAPRGGFNTEDAEGYCITVPALIDKFGQFVSTYHVATDAPLGTLRRSMNAVILIPAAPDFDPITQLRQLDAQQRVTQGAAACFADFSQVAAALFPKNLGIFLSLSPSPSSQALEHLVTIAQPRPPTQTVTWSLPELILFKNEDVLLQGRVDDFTLGHAAFCSVDTVMRLSPTGGQNLPSFLDTVAKTESLGPLEISHGRIILARTVKTDDSGMFEVALPLKTLFALGATHGGRRFDSVSLSAEVRGLRGEVIKADISIPIAFAPMKLDLFVDDLDERNSFVALKGKVRNSVTNEFVSGKLPDSYMLESVKFEILRIPVNKAHPVKYDCGGYFGALEPETGSQWTGDIRSLLEKSPPGTVHLGWCEKNFDENLSEATCLVTLEHSDSTELHSQSTELNSNEYAYIIILSGVVQDSRTNAATALHTCSVHFNDGHSGFGVDISTLQIKTDENYLPNDGSQQAEVDLSKRVGLQAVSYFVADRASAITNGVQQMLLLNLMYVTLDNDGIVDSGELQLDLGTKRREYENYIYEGKVVDYSNLESDISLKFDVSCGMSECKKIVAVAWFNAESTLPNGNDTGRNVGYSVADNGIRVGLGAYTFPVVEVTDEREGQKDSRFHVGVTAVVDGPSKKAKPDISEVWYECGSTVSVDIIFDTEDTSNENAPNAASKDDEENGHIDPVQFSGKNVLEAESFVLLIDKAYLELRPLDLAGFGDYFLEWATHNLPNSAEHKVSNFNAFGSSLPKLTSRAAVEAIRKIIRRRWGRDPSTPQDRWPLTREEDSVSSLLSSPDSDLFYSLLSIISATPTSRLYNRYVSFESGPVRARTAGNMLMGVLDAAPMMDYSLELPESVSRKENSAELISPRQDELADALLHIELVKMNADGKGKIQMQLPDIPGTYVLKVFGAIQANQTLRFGSSMSDISVAKSAFLTVRAPRYIRQYDSVAVKITVTSAEKTKEEKLFVHLLGFGLEGVRAGSFPPPVTLCDPAPAFLNNPVISGLFHGATPVAICQVAAFDSAHRRLQLRFPLIFPKNVGQFELIALLQDNQTKNFLDIVTVQIPALPAAAPVPFGTTMLIKATEESATIPFETSGVGYGGLEASASLGMLSPLLTLVNRRLVEDYDDEDWSFKNRENIPEVAFTSLSQNFATERLDMQANEIGASPSLSSLPKRVRDFALPVTTLLLALRTEESLLSRVDRATQLADSAKFIMEAAAVARHMLPCYLDPSTESNTLDPKGLLLFPWWRSLDQTNTASMSKSHPLPKRPSLDFHLTAIAIDVLSRYVNSVSLSSIRGIVSATEDPFGDDRQEFSHSANEMIRSLMEQLETALKLQRTYQSAIYSNEKPGKLMDTTDPFLTLTAPVLGVLSLYLPPEDLTKLLRKVPSLSVPDSLCAAYADKEAGKCFLSEVDLQFAVAALRWKGSNSDAVCENFISECRSETLKRLRKQGRTAYIARSQDRVPLSDVSQALAVELLQPAAAQDIVIYLAEGAGTNGLLKILPSGVANSATLLSTVYALDIFDKNMNPQLFIAMSTSADSTSIKSVILREDGQYFPLLDAHLSGNLTYATHKLALSTLEQGSKQKLILQTNVGGDGTVALSVSGEMLPAVKDDTPSLYKGIEIKKSFVRTNSNSECTNEEIDVARPGDIICIVLAITSPDWLQEVVVIDELPAGLETRALDNENDDVFSECQRNGGRAAEGNISWRCSVLSPGHHRLSFQAFANVEGSFSVPFARAYQKAAPEVMGRSAGKLAGFKIIDTGLKNT